jgi:MFS family permease
VLLAVRFSVPSAGLAFALAVPNGITSVASAIGVQTLVQQTVRAEQRGRVLGSLGASGALLSLAGAAVGGALGELVGIVPALDVAASLVALSGVVVLRLWGPAPDSLPHSSLRSTDRRRPARVP